jgi:hypothetical protein
MKMKGGGGKGGGDNGTDPSWSQNYSFDRSQESIRFSAHFLAASAWNSPVFNRSAPPSDIVDTPTVPPRKPPTGGMKSK